MKTFFETELCGIKTIDKNIFVESCTLIMPNNYAQQFYMHTCLLLGWSTCEILPTIFACFEGL